MEVGPAQKGAPAVSETGNVALPRYINIMTD